MRETLGLTWFVRILLAQRVLTSGTFEFKVKFDGPYALTCEPYSKIPEELVFRYIKRRRSNMPSPEVKIKKLQKGWVAVVVDAP